MRRESSPYVVFAFYREEYWNIHTSDILHSSKRSEYLGPTSFQGFLFNQIRYTKGQKRVSFTPRCFNQALLRRKRPKTGFWGIWGMA